jgi:hypothetical protein
MGDWKMRLYKSEPSRSSTSKTMKTPTAASEIRTTTHQAGDLEGSSRLIPRLFNALVGSMPWISGAEVDFQHAFDHPPPA